jgi:hypothetical protein
VDDIVNLIDGADERQLWSKLPEFVARKPERLPPFRVDDLDLCLAVQRIAALEEKVSFVVGQCTQLSTMTADMKLMIASSSLHSLTAVTGATGQQSASAGLNMCAQQGSSTSSGPQPSTSWANLAGTASFDPVVQRRPTPPPAPAARSSSTPFLRGAKPTGTGRGQTVIQGVPRQITAFVGRLHKDTTEDALRNLLIAAGVKDAQCKLIVAKNGREFPTAAFRVSCSITWSNIFYRSETWPEGAELRDWVFYGKKSN